MTGPATALPVTVELARPLAAAAPSVEAVAWELTDVALALGLDCNPVVRIETTAAPPGDLGIRLLVAGRWCGTPALLVGEALAVLRGSPTVQVPGSAVQLLDRLRAEQIPLSELLAVVCRAAVSADPGVLAPDHPWRRALAAGINVAGIDGAGLAEPDHEDAVELLIADRAAETLDIVIDPAFLRRLSGRDDAPEMMPYLRDSLWTELGVDLPPMRFVGEPALGADRFAFRFQRLTTMPRVGLPAGSSMVGESPDGLVPWGVTAVPTVNPATGRPCAVVPAEAAERLDAGGLTTWDPFGHFVLAFAGEIRRHAHTLMTARRAAEMLGPVAAAFPALAHALTGRVSDARLSAVLRELLEDGVPVRNLRRILEVLIRYETEPDERDTDRVTAVRTGLRDLIAGSAMEGTTLVAYLLAPALEADLAAAVRSPDAAFEELSVRLCGLVAAQRAAVDTGHAGMPAVLTRAALRPAAREALRRQFPDIRVLSWADLPPYCTVQPLARLG